MSKTYRNTPDPDRIRHPKRNMQLAATSNGGQS